MSQEEVVERLNEISEDGYEGPVYGNSGPKTSRFIRVLEVGTPGDFIVDEDWPGDLQKVDPSGQGYGMLNSAIKHVLRKHLVLWQRVRKEGRIKCLDARERLERTEAEICRAGRRAKTASVVVASADMSELSTGERSRANSLAVHAHLIQAASKPKTIQKLADKGESADKGLLAEWLLLS